jgi:hypothetical protein
VIANSTVKLANGDSLKFPLLAMDKYSFSVKRTEDDLTVTWSSLMKSGWFDGLRLIDALGGLHIVSGVEVLHGVGLFWGFNPFYGRRVKVQLEVNRMQSGIRLDNVKADLVRLIKSWAGWKSRDDYDELLSDITGAVSMGALMESLTKRGF